jgi:hydrogenase expression/formation protein HypD
VDDQSLIGQVFRPAPFAWRRLGEIENSGYQLKPQYQAFNAWERFAVEQAPVSESPVCISDQIMLGLKKPCECPAFGKSCTPQRPLGATMAPSEGTCSLYYEFRHNHKEALEG